MITSPSKLVIFEGPDGGGKTTIAKAWAERSRSYYAHHGPSPMTKGPELAFEYINTMLPAIRGNSNVVMDRSWFSEKPYGLAFRGGLDRLGDEMCAGLETLALQASMPFLVLCLPSWEAVERSFAQRRGEEMLKGVTQLSQVYRAYDDLSFKRMRDASRLPTLIYNYERMRPEDLFELLEIR